MISVVLDELYDLIKSLTKSEKRCFKLTVSSEDHAADISKLFDELEKAPGFNKDHWPETNSHYLDSNSHWADFMGPSVG